MADRLEPKGTEAGGGFNGAVSWSESFPVDSSYLTPHHFKSGTWKPRISPGRESEPRGEPKEVRAWDVGRSEGRRVTRRIRVAISPGTKVSPRPTGLSLRESVLNRLGKGESKERRLTPVHSRSGRRTGRPSSGRPSSVRSDGCRCETGPGGLWICSGRVACRFAGMLKYEREPRSSTLPTRSTSTSVDWRSGRAS